jgi:hypothetical protein
VVGKKYDSLHTPIEQRKGVSQKAADDSSKADDIHTRYAKKMFSFTLIALLLAFIAGCQSYPRPRFRPGAYYGAPIGITYPDPEDLGKHGYTNGWSEKIGMVYTCRGGFVDLGHLRDSADRTAYCAKITLEKLMEGDTKFSFRVLEPSQYFITINYPDNWAELPDKEEIASEASIALGQYFAYITMVWHEIITWYGYKSTAVFSEYISSFSWEDLYSDVIGTHIAAKALALKEDGYHFDDAMTVLIDKELQNLIVKPADVARSAEQKITGKWYEGIIYPFVSLKKRNLDIGLDDDCITPWLVPGICPDSKPRLYPVPNIDFLFENGFSVELEIEPKIMESNKLLKIIYPDGGGKYVRPSIHFPLIMEHITNVEIGKYGPEVIIPEL